VRPPPHYSVSPLPSFCTVPISVRGRSPTLAEALGAIWRALRGTPLPAAEQWRQARIIDRLAAEFAEDQPPE
jgi:hypothetical protein